MTGCSQMFVKFSPVTRVGELIEVLQEAQEEETI